MWMPLSHALPWIPSLFTVVIFTFAILLRCYKIHIPAYVCWDEIHFGKMAGYYINGTCFLDVHPPLGKLIIAGIGWLCGYDGTFAFSEPGDSYISFNSSKLMLVPYTAMRIGCASFGILTVLMVHFIILNIVGSRIAAFITSIFLIFDNGMLVLSRFILLDPILLFFMFASLLSLVKLSLCQDWLDTRIDKSFTKIWWFYLLSCGVFLGFSVSVKFVGLFMVAYVGLWTVKDLWNMMQYLPQHGILYLFKHFSYRVLGLILVPGLVYIGTYVLHFNLLSKDGPGSPFHSSLFQTTLKGNPLYNQSLSNIETGSVVVIRNNNIEQMYLHSHAHFYPSQWSIDASIQQVTGYSSKDSNNLWKLDIQHDVINKSVDTPSTLLHHGDIITMQHVLSSKILSLDKMKGRWLSAPLSKWRLLVGGEDKNSNSVNGSEYWKIEAVGSLERSSHLHTITSLLKFFNVQAQCYLCSSNKALPDWGKKQHEIICSNGLRNTESCVWCIESAVPTMPETKVESKMAPIVSFYMKFLETHKIMMHQNSKLIKRAGDKVSKPWHWPLNYKPKLFSKAEDHIYLQGTPAVWLINLVALISFIFIYLITSIIDARASHIKNSCFNFNTLAVLQSDLLCSKVLKTCLYFFAGWFIHYVPYFFMNRVLFFHHYFSAHVFACMLSGTLLDLLILESANFLTMPLSVWSVDYIRCILAVLITAVVTFSFYEAFPL